MDQLSGREHEIIELAGEGFTDKEIAKKLEISITSVRTYWERVRVKTRAKNRSEAIVRVLLQEIQASTKDAQRARQDRDLLLEQAEGYAVFSLDPQGKIVDWNAGVQRVLGFAKEEFLGAPFDIVFTPDD